jgi:formate dehydrogenase major subunit
MTNGWIDIKNTDMMLIMGGNPAENHPCGFKWAIEAKRQRNAKDDRRRSALHPHRRHADLFVQIRAGADIAFLGGVIATPSRISASPKSTWSTSPTPRSSSKEGFKLPEDGLYSGFDEASKTYDRSLELRRPAAAPNARRCPAECRLRSSLEHPRCVYQLLKKQYSRYTPEMVERITGIPKDQFLKAADLFTSVRKDGDMKKVATIIYAVGWTQHSFGTQIIRTGGHAATAAGQRGPRRRRRQRAARPLQHSGRHRYGRHLRHPAGLSEDPNPADKDFDAWMKRTTPKPSKPGPNGTRSTTGRTRRSSPFPS